MFKSSMWDERYAGKDFFYGREPNDFLRDHAAQLPKGRVLCLAEGEGRNAAFLAQQGFQVTAVDQSAVGLAKARALSSERNVSIQTVQTDLGTFEPAAGYWQGIVSIWAHMPAPARASLHQRCVAGLASGGVFLLEAYTPRQIEKRTGGPADPFLLMNVEDLRRELTGLHFLLAREIERDVREGAGHNGISAVVQILAIKP